MVFENFKQNTLFLIAALILCAPLMAQQGNKEPFAKVVDNALDFSVQQALRMALALKDQQDQLPKSTDRFGNLQTCRSDWWTSGFFPGMLWYLYEYSGNEEIKKQAQEYTSRVMDQQYTRDNHDVGFIINCSFGNGYRITMDSSYRDVMYTASKSLSTRFRPVTGCIRSWDSADWNRQWQYPVIIDNMMNLELLMTAAAEFNEPRFSDIALSHAGTTMKNHYRPDYSCFHVVSYDTVTGLPQHKHTSQGFSHASAWARGQAWGLYGFTMMYRFTRDTAWLTMAEHIARFIMHHPRLPDDKIPYWDFDAPNIPDCNRDASAGAIICSALIELSEYVDPSLAKECLSVAETPDTDAEFSLYRNAPCNNGNFILKHGVGHMPNNSEVDVPLMYADYYYVEALMRYRNLILK